MQENKFVPAANARKNSPLSRRKFFTTTSAGIVTGLVVTNSIAKNNSSAPALELATNPTSRADQALKIRTDAAILERSRPIPNIVTNGDEIALNNRIGCFTKTLPHDAQGMVNGNAYNLYLKAMNSGLREDYEAIPLGGPGKLINPQAGLAFDLEGTDSHQLSIPAAPAFSSAEEAGEMAELYWQALSRDLHFEEYNFNPYMRFIANDLNRFSEFKGPRNNSRVLPATLFRGTFKGDEVGPYISQFLFKDIPNGAQTIKQQYRVPNLGNDHMQRFSDWLRIQNGNAPIRPISYDETPRYIRNNRDLGEYVHLDYTYQAFLNAALILLGFGRTALDENNPYLTSRTQNPFSTFGAPQVLDVVARVANSALKAAWYQKWNVHRRLRPEEFGGCVHSTATQVASHPIHEELLRSNALQAVYDFTGSYLLPMAYPEGCPAHPAYPSGHATIAGACVTVLKAFFNEDFVIPNPVYASPDGLDLFGYRRGSLTVGGELNKLASNIAIGRNAAGVHWRSDALEGLKLGEAVALSCLQNFRLTFNEPFSGSNLTKFDGEKITI